MQIATVKNIAATLFAAAMAAGAATYTWTGAASSSMNDPLNYDDETGAPASAAPG